MSVVYCYVLSFYIVALIVKRCVENNIVHTVSYTYTYTHAHTHMHIHTCTYTHAHAHMHYYKKKFFVTESDVLKVFDSLTPNFSLVI